ncbi:MAG: sensor histidine kinase [Clostridiaceae bacterium]|nr:sensor histidine kinase [Clostridiaceae bacterium]
MMKIRLPKKIRSQITIFYFLASLITIILMGLIFYVSISNIVLNQSLSSTKTAISKSGNYVELYVAKLKSISNIMVKDPLTIRYLSENTNLVMKNDLSTLIKNTIESDASIKSIVIVGKDSTLLSNEENLNMSMSSDMMKEQWYVDAINSNSMPVLTKARMQKFSMDKGNWVISLSQEIKDDKGNNLGVLLIDIKYMVIDNFLNDLNEINKGYAFILNNKSEVVYHKDTNYFVDSNLQSKLINESKMAQGYDTKKKILIEPYKIKNTDWTLMGVSSLYELKAIKRQLLETIIFMGLLLVFIAAYSSSYFAGRITRPLAKLEKAMEEIEKGLSKVEITEQGCYEVQSLALHFNNMINKIERLLEEIAQKEKYLRTFELNVLQSQINPHFLYNTLDTIVWMAEFNNTKKVISVTKALAQFFRLSLSGGSELTTVEKEIEHVKQYLYIQKERYEDKLNYDFQFDSAISDCRILKIILQPIVENAIYHGIRETDRPGHIKITAGYKEDGILFTVKDTGQGFDLCILEKEEVKKDIKLGGVGIKNVDKRIKLFYGEEYGVKIESEIGVGTTVYIKIGLQ